MFFQPFPIDPSSLLFLPSPLSLKPGLKFLLHTLDNHFRCRPRIHIHKSHAFMAIWIDENEGTRVEASREKNGLEWNRLEENKKYITICPKEMATKLWSISKTEAKVLKFAAWDLSTSLGSECGLRPVTHVDASSLVPTVSITHHDLSTTNMDPETLP